MRIVIAVLIIILLFWAFPVLSGDSTNPMQRDIKLLREAFDGPLRAEFEMRGLSKDDSAQASTDALDWLVSCWRNRQDNSSDRTEETIMIRLGGNDIFTYATPCMYEFFELVGVPSK